MRNSLLTFENVFMMWIVLQVPGDSRCKRILFSRSFFLKAALINNDGNVRLIVCACNMALNLDYWITWFNTGDIGEVQKNIPKFRTRSFIMESKMDLNQTASTIPFLWNPFCLIFSPEQYFKGLSCYRYNPESESRRQSLRAKALCFFWYNRSEQHSVYILCVK